MWGASHQDARRLAPDAKSLHSPAITACKVQIALSLILHYALDRENVPLFVSVRGSLPVQVVMLKKL